MSKIIHRLRDVLQTENYTVHLFGWHEIPKIHLYFDAEPTLAMTVDLWFTLDEAEALAAKLTELANEVKKARK